MPRYEQLLMRGHESVTGGFHTIRLHLSSFSRPGGSHSLGSPVRIHTTLITDLIYSDPLHAAGGINRNTVNYLAGIWKSKRANIFPHMKYQNTIILTFDSCSSILLF